MAPMMGYIVAEDKYSSRKWYIVENEDANAIRSLRPLHSKSKDRKQVHLAHNRVCPCHARAEVGM